MLGEIYLRTTFRVILTPVTRSSVTSNLVFDSLKRTNHNKFDTLESKTIIRLYNVSKSAAFNQTE